MASFKELKRISFFQTEIRSCEGGEILIRVQSRYRIGGLKTNEIDFWRSDFWIGEKSIKWSETRVWECEGELVVRTGRSMSVRKTVNRLRYLRIEV